MNSESYAADSIVGEILAPITGSSVVSLTIPCSPEYVGTARLTILGVASRMGFSYDQVEDIRLAVGEACTNAIARAEGSEQTTSATISIASHIEASQLIIEITDTVAINDTNAIGTDLDQLAGDDVNPAELGALLMEILVDEVSLQTSPTGTYVRLTKYAAVPGMTG